MAGVQADQDQSCNDQPGRGNLGDQYLAAKILREPARPPLRDGISAKENDDVAHPGNHLHHGGRSTTDGKDDRKEPSPARKRLIM
jgi:hypothetical protein